MFVTIDYFEHLQDVDVMNSSPQFLLGFTPYGVRSLGYDKRVSCVHCYGITQSSFPAPKMSCAPPVHPFLPPTSDNHGFLLSV